MSSKKNDSPRWPLRSLRWFCPPHLLEEIEGDLIQKFERDEKRYNTRKAKRRLFWNTLRFFRPEIILRNKLHRKHKPFLMLNHFLKIFVRTSLKNASYSFINISGLAVGLACCIFALLWILDETSFDRFHNEGNLIYSIRTNFTFDDGISTFPNTPGPLAEAVRSFPEVDESCRTAFSGPVLFSHNKNSFNEEGIYADTSLFKIFTFTLTEGDPDKPLPDNNSIVISEQLAKKYFGNTTALGKVIRINNNSDARVTAVMRDLPSQSTLQFTFVLSYSLYAKEDLYNNEWGAWTGGGTYVKLHLGSDINAIEKKLSTEITHPKIWPRWGNNVELILFGLEDWHLKSFENGKITDGNNTYIQAFALIAAFILIIASVNFMNLATARSVSRAKEIGVRKAIGTTRSSLTNQFIGESILLSFISLLFGLLIVHISLPLFNSFTSKQISIDYFNPILPISLISITLLTGLLAGSYPAFFLSSLQTMHVLKGKLSRGTGAGVRKALVVFQFSISVVLIISALIIYKQIEFMRNKNLGFDKENVFYLNTTPKLSKDYDAFRQGLFHHPEIESVSRASEEPMSIGTGLEMGDDAWKGKTKQDNIAFRWLFCDQDFLQAFHFNLKAGRNFSTTSGADSSNFIITEEAAKRMRLAEPVGESLKVDRAGSIIGVVNDFHSAGLSKPILPVIISMRLERATRIFIRYEKDKLTEAVNLVQSEFKKLEADFPMEYFFLDDSFNRLYRDEIQIGRLANAFMAIAVFISCLGLFGLSSFTAESRIKEVGIRKILGATVTQLVSLLCRDFVVLVVAALVIGFPVAWWAGNKFLESYAFRTNIGVSIFAITATSLIALALITVAWQSARAAIANPTKNLRAE
jgi:putative ABC transport system permease protein